MNMNPKIIKSGFYFLLKTTYTRLDNAYSVNVYILTSKKVTTFTMVIMRNNQIKSIRRSQNIVSSVCNKCIRHLLQSVSPYTSGLFAGILSESG